MMAADATEPTPNRDVYMPDHRMELLSSPRWVRVRLGGEFVADTKRVMMLRETAHLPVYYFPREDVRMDRLEATAHHGESPGKGRATYYTVTAGDRVAENAAWSYPDPPAEGAGLRDCVTFAWRQMDAWFEEEEEVFVHPRDPYHRVDVLPSSRHVRVELDGEVVAETRRPHLLFETGLPTRYYIPPEDVHTDLLEATDTTSRCPYKGIASYWSARIGDAVHRDIVWCYPEPIPECPKVRGLLCFFNERATIYVDGDLQPRPKTPWS